MSRLGVVRWLPSLDTLSNSSSNSTAPLFSPSAKEEWIQADVAISACMIVVLVVHAHFCHLTKLGLSTLFTLLSLVVTIILAPIVGAILSIFTCYRRVVAALVRLSVGQQFGGLLDGTDAFWALEDDTSLSVINVLALADFSFIVSASTQDDEPLQTISELIEDRLLTTPPPFPKLMSHRKLSHFGYYHWEKQEKIAIDDYVRWMDIEDQGDQNITESALKNFVSSVMNKPLPANHEAGWEILVGRYPIKPSSDLFDAMENGGWITKSCAGVRYPVLFRIHHSIGDGVALVNLLLDTLGDPCTRSSTPVPSLRCSSPTFNKNFVQSTTTPINEEHDKFSLISSWQESDTTKCSKSFSCDFSLDIPLDSVKNVKRRNSYDFSDHCNFDDCHNKLKIEDLTKTVKSACRNVFKIIEHRNDFKNKFDKQNKIEDFDIVVNERPSGEFLELMSHATILENQYVQASLTKNKIIDCLFKNSTTLISLILHCISSLIKPLRAITQQCSVFLFAPASLFNQAMMHSQDNNLLHGPTLSGHKVVAWYFEQQDNSDQLLMSMIKRIRSKTGVRFSDVLLTALSDSLESFYAQCNEVPSYITVVIPARMGPPQTATIVTNSRNLCTRLTNSNNTLENKFSVAMLPLPIANTASKKLKCFSKLNQVKKHCDFLRGSPDYLINYWLLKVIATALPTCLLKPLVQSTQATLVLSNLPGPRRLTKLAGHTLHDLVFWVPNRTTTGVGMTVLSYAGRLQLGLIADRALIACQQDAQLILDGVASAINQMDLTSSIANDIATVY